MARTVGDVALEYATTYKWSVFPLIPGRKEPLGRLAPHGFQSAVTKPSTIRNWWNEEPTAGIAVATGLPSGIFVVDADVKNGAKGDEEWKHLIATNGDIPLTPIAETPSGGRHYYFQYPSDIEVVSSVKTFSPSIDIRGKGGYIILPPTINGKGAYRWVVPPTTVQPALAPAWLIRRLIAAQARPTRPLSEDKDPIMEGTRNTTLSSIAGRYRRGGMSTKEVYIALSAINRQRCHPQLPIDDIKRIALSNARYPAHTSAQQQVDALNTEEEALVRDLTRIFGPVPTVAFDTVVTALRTEESGDAKLAARLHGDRILYYAPEKKWYVFDGLYWVAFPVKALRYTIMTRLALIYSQMNTQCMEEVTKGNTTNRSTAEQLSKRYNAVLNGRRQRDVFDMVEGMLTRDDETHNHATYIKWDANPDLFAVQNGVIDLRTGTLRKTDAKDYIRTVSAVTWEGITARCPLWLHFIKHIHSDDTTVVRFVQRLFGYALTGHAQEHYVTILYGSKGRNGKGVLLELIGDIMGKHALAVSKNILVDSGRKQSASAATPHLAQLRGKRMVWCSETKEDDRADAGILKYLSGEDTVNARDLWETGGNSFKPTHTLFLATNHRPHLPASDEATWARIITLEYKRRYLDDPDPNNPNEFPIETKLKERLISEASGILAWLVRGSMRWYMDGLQRPQHTKNATRDYRTQEDWALRWVEARCVVDPHDYTLASVLYDDFTTWWDRSDRAPSQTAFGRRLTEMGFIAQKDTATSRMVRHGLRIATVATTLDQPIDFGRVEN